MLLQELHLSEQKTRYPIYITHTKPAEMDAIMQEIKQLNHEPVFAQSAMQPAIKPVIQPACLSALPPEVPAEPVPRLHQIGYLVAGQEFEV